MPAPQKAQLESVVSGLLQANELRGENGPELASAIAEALAGALDRLAQMAQVAPGIACTPAASAAPGRLM